MNPVTGALSGTFSFELNGERIEVTNEPACTTLLEWLRRNGRTGTKTGCSEGDCGACTVTILEKDAHGKTTWRSINSCLVLLPMLAGRTVLSVEGLEKAGTLHPVQSAMVAHGGSQCGYCTPGVVMSLFEGCQRGTLREPARIADQLCGNLCRCTGYRPIRDAAFEVFKAPRADDPWGRAQAAALEAVSYASTNGSFFRPASLAELLRLKGLRPNARLVGGATEIGVEINKQFARFPELISTEAVPELTRIYSTPAAWHIGAAATLTQIEETLGGEFPSLARMLRHFASRQIRNRATLGGNLATASPIGDSAPVLLSLDAVVLLTSQHGERLISLSDFFTGYRQTLMRADEVLREIQLPRIEGRRAQFLKVSKRREMDISIVSAAFCIGTDAAGIVTHARMAFGGVAASPARAPDAEAALLGKPLKAARELVAGQLKSQFTPIDDLRGSARYRQALIVNLWEKFLDGDDEKDPADPDDFVPGPLWAAESPSRALPHESAVSHVTGRAQYVDDIAQRRPMLELWPVCAPHAHARIIRRNAGAALKVPGVRAVLMAQDIPGHNQIGAARKDEKLLADTLVPFHGAMIAMVVGESLEACRLGARAMIVEYEPLPAVLSVQDAVAADSFHTQANFMRRGDAASALDGSMHQLGGEFECGGQEHFYLETQAAWAEVDLEGNVSVTSSTQHPSEIQVAVADVLGLPRNRVVVQAPRMGGGFGGKETQGNAWAALAALAALKTGRAVRIQLDRDLDMQLTGKRHPFHARFRVGFDGEGRLGALECHLISNAGWALDLSAAVTDRALFHLDNAYYIPAVEISGRVAKTNLTSQTAFRGFGGPQGMLVIEEIIDRVARHLGLPAHEVRERNFYHGQGETNTTHYGQEIGDNRLQRIWRELMIGSGFHERRQAIEQWNSRHANLKRGLAITPVKFGISFTYTPYNQAGALVLIYRDGTVQINHGGTEMGQGLMTKVLGIAMRELGLPAHRIRMMPTATDKVPNTSATAASSGSDLNGAAVQNACVELRGRLARVAAGLYLAQTQRIAEAGEFRFSEAQVALADWSCPFADLVERAYMERLGLSATGYYSTPGIHWNRDEGKGRPFHYFACGAAVSEVEVDGATGMSRIRRVDILQDVGESLNPGIDRGQIEGGFVQGAGWLTSEDLRWDDKGRLLSHSASTYAIPAFGDAPADFRVELLSDAGHSGVVHGSKAVGEPPLMLAISVREAIREAVAAFTQAKGPIRLPSPATPEVIFSAIHNL